MHVVTIKTSDNLTLAGLLWNSRASRSALLLHMMPATKESWIPLGDKLYALGVNVLAIDFRGHGQSGGGDYRQFTPERHESYYIDVEAAALYLDRHYPDTELYLGGASIGANMTIRYLSRHHESRKGFALSAGLDYYGVRAIDFVPDLSPQQQVLFVGSYDDGRKSGLDCGRMAEQLYDATPAKKYKIIYETGGHGTDMWKTHSKLIDQLVAFLSAD